MKIQILGTAAAEGLPALFCECDNCKTARALGGKNLRTRSSCLIDDKYMIDFSPDTYFHVLKNNLDLSKVEHLLITHSHWDHFYPEDIMMRKEPYAHVKANDTMYIYGNKEVAEKFDSVNYEPDDEKRVVFKEIEPFVTYKIGDAEVTPLLADHIPTEKCFLYLFMRGGKTFLYGHDTGFFPDKTWEYLSGKRIDAAILDCTFGPKNNERGHMGFPQCVRIKNLLQKMNCTDKFSEMVITHFSHNCGLPHDELEKLAKPEDMLVAYDGMIINI